MDEYYTERLSPLEYYTEKLFVDFKLLRPDVEIISRNCIEIHY